MGEARLLSLSGMILERWNGHQVYAGRSLVACPPDLGGGRLAVVGFDLHADSGQYAGQLCAFDVDGDMSTPRWSRFIEDRDLPQTLRDDGQRGAQFGVIRVHVKDYFPDRQGLEILAVYQHAHRSPCAVRIYDAAGTVLFQLWHDGGLGQAYLMSGPRLLVLAGTNGEALWSERGHPEVKYHVHPAIIFAVPLRVGEIGDHVMGAGSGNWYKCMLLPKYADKVAAWTEFEAPQIDHDPSRHLMVGLWLRGKTKVGITWVVDEFGVEVPRSRVIGDQYGLDSEAPPPVELFIGDLPPVTTVRAEDPQDPESRP